MNYQTMTSQELDQEYAYLHECWDIYRQLFADALGMNDYALAASHLDMVDWCEALAWEIIAEFNCRQEEM